MRNEIVDKAKPGDQCIFTGSLIVVPETISLMKPGVKVELNSRTEGNRKPNQLSLDGVTGL